MVFNLQTLFTCLILIVGAIIATPVMIKGLKKRRTGIYEPNFVIQRLPQVVLIPIVILLVIAFLFFVRVFKAELIPCGELFVLTSGHPHGVLSFVSWLGVLIFLSGACFTVGGWYNLGEYFSTDSKILQGQGVRKTGLYGYVMHPIYSGIIQCFIGASLAATSIICLLYTLFVVAPMWLRRAKYEEEILVKHLGPDYKEYGEEMKWRRLIPTVFPFGV